MHHPVDGHMASGTYSFQSPPSRPGSGHKCWLRGGRRALIGFVVFVILAAGALAPGEAEAQKVGVGAWESASRSTLAWVEKVSGLGWYYNWRPDQLEADRIHARSVEFVPMIHSVAMLEQPIVSDRPVAALLSFNEPDGAGSHQANMSVAEAIAVWPDLVAKAGSARIGSPATTQAQTLGPGSWQGRFMHEAEAKGLRVDFMAVHYYSRDGDVAAFRDWLERVHAEYRRPIWVTEFAMIDWNSPDKATFDQNAVFLEQAMRMMNELPFVERYAWFSANPYAWQGTVPKIHLLHEPDGLTPVGKRFELMVGLGPSS